MVFSTTRRAVISAVAIIPAMAVTASVSNAQAAPNTDGSLFHQRLAAFERANAEFLRTCRTPCLPDDVQNEACCAAGDAYDVMLATPAPDLASMARKIDALARWSSGSEIPNDEIALIAADARRLVSGER
jgi:hypothetical protein